MKLSEFKKLLEAYPDDLEVVSYRIGGAFDYYAPVQAPEAIALREIMNHPTLAGNYVEGSDIKALVV